MNDANVELARGAYDAFNRGDVPAVLGVMADDVEWHQAAGMRYGGVYHSPKEVLDNVFAHLGTDLEGFTVTPERFIPGGDSVVVMGRYTGTGTDTGRRLDVPFVHVWNLRDGKLARFDQFTDTALFNEVVPAQRVAHA